MSEHPEGDVMEDGASGSPASGSAETGASGSPAKAIGCVLGVLAIFLAPLLVAGYLVMTLVGGDGDVKRDLGDEARIIDVPPADSAVSSTLMYLGDFGDPLEFGATASGPAALYLRFPLDFPPETEIVYADIILRCEHNLEGSGSAPMASIIELLDEDDQPPFSPMRFPQPDDLKSIPIGPEAVRWEVDPWEAGGDYATPDISFLIESFLARPGYRPLNAMGIRIRGESKTPADVLDNSHLRAVSPGGGTGPYLRVILAGAE